MLVLMTEEGKEVWVWMSSVKGREWAGCPRASPGSGRGRNMRGINHWKHVGGVQENSDEGENNLDGASARVGGDRAIPRSSSDPRAQSRGSLGLHTTCRSKPPPNPQTFPNLPPNDQHAGHALTGRGARWGCLLADEPQFGCSCSCSCTSVAARVPT